MTPKPPYQTHDSMRRRYDRVARRMALRADSVDDLLAWQAEVRRRLRALTGYDTMEHPSAPPVNTSRDELADHYRERWEIETEPGVVMPVFVLIPKVGAAPYPVVIAPHGHGGGGKAAVAGIRDDEEISQAIDGFHYDYGVSFVRRGYIVFCPDARGFGERREEIVKDQTLASSCQWLNQMALPLGRTVVGMWVWDLHRLIDHIATRADCDTHRLACAGLSGGGLQTLWSAALDERIRCAVVSGYFYGFRDSLLELIFNCSCNYVPHLFATVDMGDLGALIAPRPLLIETGDQDVLNGPRGLDNVYPQVEITRRAYRLLDAEDRLHHAVFSGPHRWDGIEALPWVDRQLRL